MIRWRGPVFVTLFLLGGQRAAVAQQFPYTLPPKDPTLATVLGVMFTGAGQFYTGHVARGLVEFGVTAGGVAVLSRRCTSSESTCSGNRNMGWLLALGGWAWGAGTAADDARDYNDKHFKGATRPDGSGSLGYDLASATKHWSAEQSARSALDRLASPYVFSKH